jgi:uncharacterized protein with HEPN domain
MNERDHAYLRDMLDAAREAMGFVRGLDSGALETDRKLALALVQEMAIIGEAAGRVSPEVARSVPGIPWPKIVGMRNRLIHGSGRLTLKSCGRPLPRIYHTSWPSWNGCSVRNEELAPSVIIEV